MQPPTFADIYDRVVGPDFWDLWWPHFKALTARHGLTWNSVCDVACGTGEALHRLAAPEVRRYGTDQSPDMIRVATAKCPDAHLWVGPMQALQVPEPVDLLLCAYDSLNMLPTEQALKDTLAGFAAALSPGGHVVCDLATVTHLSEDWGTQEIHTTADDLETVWHTVWDPRRWELTVHLTVTVPRPDQGVWLVTERVVERGFPKALVDRAIERAGLTTLDVSDLMSGRPGSDGGRRLVYLLRKPSGVQFSDA